MECLKCRKTCKGTQNLKLNEHLTHVNQWFICDDCKGMSVAEAARYAHNYYVEHRDHYATLQKEYKSKPTLSYAKNILADRKDYKAKDISDDAGRLKMKTIQLNSGYSLPLLLLNSESFT